MEIRIINHVNNLLAEGIACFLSCAAGISNTQIQVIDFNFITNFPRLHRPVEGSLSPPFGGDYKQEKDMSLFRG